MLVTAKEAVVLTLILFGFCNLNAVSCADSDAVDRNKKRKHDLLCRSYIKSKDVLHLEKQYIEAVVLFLE